MDTQKKIIILTLFLVLGVVSIAGCSGPDDTNLQCPNCESTNLTHEDNIYYEDSTQARWYRCIDCKLAPIFGERF